MKINHRQFIFLILIIQGQIYFPNIQRHFSPIIRDRLFYFSKWKCPPPPSRMWIHIMPCWTVIKAFNIPVASCYWSRRCTRQIWHSAFIQNTSPVSATMSTSFAVVTNDIYALTSAYWGLGCVFYQPGGAQMRCPKLTCNDILASRTYFTTGWC